MDKKARAQSTEGGGSGTVVTDPSLTGSSLMTAPASRIRVTDRAAEVA
jgi:hypothetical protein